MSLRRILKLLLAFLTGQGVTVLTQLLIPPFFIHRYTDGIAVYGEWIALSAAVMYLNTINYGVQTYANNQMTIHYNRGELATCKAIQATALRLLLWIILALSPLVALIMLLPIGHWLGLHHATNYQASLTLSILLVQVFVNMIFSLFVNGFMVVGQAHRGQNWGNLLRLVMVLSLAAFAWRRASFPVLAMTQLASIVLFTGIVLIDIRITAPLLLPSLRRGEPGMMRAILKPSGMFGLLGLSSFLNWQAPVLLMQKFLGPTSVAIFSLTRTIFSMSRQMLIVLTYSIGQEITHLIGQKNWKQLHRLYDLSERVVMMMIPPTSVGVLLASPFLFSIWLHKRELYLPTICILMAIASAVMSIKEHKYQFQTASNEHERLSAMMIVSYSFMLLVALPLILHIGLAGFILAWVATEIFQTAYILRLNVSLFPREYSISSVPMLRLVMVTALGFAAAAWPAYRAVSESLPVILGIAAIYMAGLATISYFAFGMNEVRMVLQARMRARHAPSV